MESKSTIPPGSIIITLVYFDIQALNPFQIIPILSEMVITERGSKLVYQNKLMLLQ